MELFDLSGRTALVTGSSRGLGYALATGLIEAGASVVLHGRDRQTLTEAAESLASKVIHPHSDSGSAGQTVHTISFDVTDAAASAAAISELVETRGVPDILVNNAGMNLREPMVEQPTENWQQVLTTNLHSAFAVSQPVVKAMVECGTGGKVINIGSVQSALGRSALTAYAASKGGIAMLTRSMAAEFAASNIQVNTLSPGYFATDMTEQLWSDEEFNSWLTRRTPAGRWGRPEELVGTLIFLASKGSDFVSGQNIFVDGGLTSVV